MRGAEFTCATAVRTPVHACAACGADTYAFNGNSGPSGVYGRSTACTPCESGLTALAEYDWCCLELSICEEPLVATGYTVAGVGPLAAPWGPEFKSCSNRQNAPTTKLCRPKDATKCLQDVNCTGVSSVCDVRREVESVTTIVGTSLALLGQSSVDAPIAYYKRIADVRMRVGPAISVPKQCPAIEAQVLCGAPACDAFSKNL